MVAIVAFLLRNNDTTWTVIGLILSTTWGVRLFLHISRRNWKKKEDYRYTNLGQLYSMRDWLNVYVRIFLLQGLLMVLISLPVIAVMYSTTEPLSTLAVVATSIWVFGIIFEAIADSQLRHFLQYNKGKIMDRGVWRYSRHPNYFGEITAWWGATLLAVAFGQWWGVIGASVITILITKISGIPLLEKRYKDNSDYQIYSSRTSKLLPLPPKKSRTLYENSEA